LTSSYLQANVALKSQTLYFYVFFVCFFLQIEIVYMVRDDEELMKNLFSELRDDGLDDARRRELAGFLRELLSLAQTLQPVPRDDFFTKLGDLGVLQAVESLLASEDAQLHRFAIDIVAHVVEHSPSMVRDFARKEMTDSRADSGGDDDLFLINLIIEQMIYDPDPELSCAMQLTGLLRVLLDPENMTANKNEMTEFLGFFYRNCMHLLMAPLLANTADERRPGKDDYQTAHLLSLILDLVTFSVEHHTYHVKNYILNKDLLRRVLVLLNSRHMFLALSALRFMRRIVSTMDDFYNRYIIKGDLMKPVVDALFLSGSRYNLVNSAILEMFEFIRSEDIKSLVAHIVENHYKQLQAIEYVKTFSGLKMRYDQQKNRENHRFGNSDAGDRAATTANHRFRRDARAMDEDEELWFDKDDDDDLPDDIAYSADPATADADTPRINIDSILEAGKTREQASKTKKQLDVDKANENLAAESKLNGALHGADVAVTPKETNSGDGGADSNTAPVSVPNGLVGLVDYSDDDSDDDGTAAAEDDDDDARKDEAKNNDPSDASSQPVTLKPDATDPSDVDEPSKKKPRLVEAAAE